MQHEWFENHFYHFNSQNFLKKTGKISFLFEGNKTKNRSKGITPKSIRQKHKIIDKYYPNKSGYNFFKEKNKTKKIE